MLAEQDQARKALSMAQVQSGRLGEHFCRLILDGPAGVVIPFRVRVPFRFKRVRFKRLGDQDDGFIAWGLFIIGAIGNFIVSLFPFAGLEGALGLPDASLVPVWLAWAVLVPALIFWAPTLQSIYRARWAVCLSRNDWRGRETPAFRVGGMTFNIVELLEEYPDLTYQQVVQAYLDALVQYTWEQEQRSRRLGVDILEAKALIEASEEAGGRKPSQTEQMLALIREVE